jgi:hypothetical protein
MTQLQSSLGLQVSGNLSSVYKTVCLLQSHRSSCCDDRTANEQPNAAIRTSLIEYGIWIEAVVSVACLDPEPVRYSNHTAQPDCRKESNGPRRGKEQDVNKHDCGRKQMEAQVNGYGKRWCECRHDEFGVNLGLSVQIRIQMMGAEFNTYRPQTPVQEADEHLKRRGNNGKGIFDVEQLWRDKDVRKKTNAESYCRDSGQPVFSKRS